MCLGNFEHGFDRLDKNKLKGLPDDNFHFDCSYIMANNVERSGDFSVLHLNIRSLCKNFEELIELITQLHHASVEIDVILLCETWLHDDNSMLVKIPGYSLFNQNRTTRGGGLAIYVRDSLVTEEVLDLSTIIDGVLEAKFVKISNFSKELFIGELYRVPNSKPTEFNTFVSNVLSKLKGKRVIMGADQNLDLLKSSEHRHTDDFVSIVLENGLIPCISLPTRVTHQSGTLIDNIYVSIELVQNIQSNVILEHISDHFPCLVQIENLYASDSRCKKIVYSRKMNDRKIASLNHVLLHSNWIERLDMNTSLNKMYTTFVGDLTKHLDTIAPLTKKVIKASNHLEQPWMTVALLKSSKKCKRLYSIGLKSGKDSQKWQHYIKYRTALNRLKRFSKREYLANEINSYQGNYKKLWSLLNSLLKRNNDKQSIIGELFANGKAITNTSEICDILNDHFSTVGQRVTKALPANLDAHKKYLLRANTNALLLSPVSEGEIDRLVSSLPVKTSKGVDNFSNILIRKIRYSIRLPLMILVNKSLLVGEFPDAMKIAKVFALHKGGVKSDLDNYRPISLLSVLSKILEKAMLARLVDFFDANNILYDKQFGFRKGHSTVNAVQQLVGDILSGFEKNFKCLALFLDLRKAFDVCHHGIMLSKLSHYGVRGTALSWFESYLSERKQFVEISGISSTMRPVKMGIPQGSILGPILMSVMINDIKNSLKLSDCILFADDTTIYLFGRNVKFLYTKMQREINLLSQWFQDNLLIVNVKKTKLMLFCPKSQNDIVNCTLQLNNEVIDRVSAFKFLGIWLDQNLIWDEHATFLLKKIVPFKFALYKLKPFLPAYCLRTIYYSFVHSRLIYGLSVWGPMLKRDTLDKLIKLQKSFIRIINNAALLANSSPLFLKSKILKLEDLISLELLKITYLYRVGKLPKSLMNLFPSHSHGYETRNYNVPKVLSHKSKVFNSSFLCKTVSVSRSYNHLFTESLPSLKTLCKNFKYEKFAMY